MIVQHSKHQIEPLESRQTQKSTSWASWKPMAMLSFVLVSMSNVLVHIVVYLREKGERDGGTWCRCSCVLQKDVTVLQVAKAATRTVQTHVNTALLQPRSHPPLYQGSLNMITPFILRRSSTTPFFSSARSHTVNTSILGQFLNHSPAWSMSLRLQRPVRQASTLQLVEAPSILKFVPNGIWRARAPQYGRARDPFRGPPPPSGFWHRLKQQINSINPQFVLWGILGLNGAVFATWYVATANAVCVLISRSMRMLQSDHCREWVTRNYTYGFMRTSSQVGVTSSKADSKYLSSFLAKNLVLFCISDTNYISQLDSVNLYHLASRNDAYAIQLPNLLLDGTASTSTSRECKVHCSLLWE